MWSPQFTYSEWFYRQDGCNFPLICRDCGGTTARFADNCLPIMDKHISISERSFFGCWRWDVYVNRDKFDFLSLTSFTLVNLFSFGFIEMGCLYRWRWTESSNFQIGQGWWENFLRVCEATFPFWLVTLDVFWVGEDGFKVVMLSLPAQQVDFFDDVWSV